MGSAGYLCGWEWFGSAWLFDQLSSQFRLKSFVFSYSKQAFVWKTAKASSSSVVVSCVWLYWCALVQALTHSSLVHTSLSVLAGTSCCCTTTLLSSRRTLMLWKSNRTRTMAHHRRNRLGSPTTEVSIYDVCTYYRSALVLRYIKFVWDTSSSPSSNF